MKWKPAVKWTRCDISYMTRQIAHVSGFGDPARIIAQALDLAASAIAAGVVQLQSTTFSPFTVQVDIFEDGKRI